MSYFIFIPMSYSEKLKHPKWQRKRLEVLQRDNFKCCLCKDEETELHVHHLKYTGQPYEAPLEDLQTLCKVCHKVVEEHKDVIISEVRLFKNDDKLLSCYMFKLSKMEILIELWENGSHRHGIYLIKDSVISLTIKEWFDE